LQIFYDFKFYVYFLGKNKLANRAYNILKLAGKLKYIYKYFLYKYFFCRKIYSVFFFHEMLVNVFMKNY